MTHKPRSQVYVTIYTYLAVVSVSLLHDKHLKLRISGNLLILSSRAIVGT